MSRETQNQKKTVDNGVTYVAVVKWSGKISGLVGRSCQERLREAEKVRGILFLFSPEERQRMSFLLFLSTP